MRSSTNRRLYRLGVVLLLLLATLLSNALPRTTARSLSLHSQNAAAIRSSSPAAPVPAPDSARRTREYGELPLSFEPNEGQTDARVKFISRGQGYTLFLTPKEAVLALRKTEEKTETGTKNATVRSNRAKSKIRRDVLRMRLVGANPAPQVEGQSELPGKSNYFIGNDRSKWLRGVRNYSRVVYRELYSGIEMVFYGRERELEYDFRVAPGADPRTIRVEFAGAEEIKLDGDGNLHLCTGGGEVVQPAPIIYQEQNGKRLAVSGRYELLGHNRIGFALAQYDQTRPLVIDPKLIYSTYYGGGIRVHDLPESVGETANGIAVDNNGNAYITGNTDSTNFPVTSNAFQPEQREVDICNVDLDIPCGDAYVAKLSADGKTIIYSTYIGSRNNDEGRAIAVDSAGNAYITGATNPSFVSKFCIFTGGWPLTSNSYQNHPCPGPARGFVDAFVTVLNSSGTDLVYSTYFGGAKQESGNAIAVDASGKVYVAGDTTSNNLDTRNAFQPARASSGNGKDGWLAKFDPRETSDNATLLYSSFLGGTALDRALGISVDAAGNAYVVGETFSSDLNVKSPSGQLLLPLQSNIGGSSDGFVAKVDVTNATGPNSLVYLTYFGGLGPDKATAVVVEASTQRAFITGRAGSLSGFPLLNDFDLTFGGGSEAFVAKLNADGTGLFYSSLLGGISFDEGRGIAIDAAGNAYVTGQTESADFPLRNAFQSILGAGGVSTEPDAFVTKISAAPVPSTPQILYSSLLGGSDTESGNAIAADRRGNVYLTGTTSSRTFPTTDGVVKESSFPTDFNLDAFVAKIESTFPDTIGVFRPGTGQFLLRNSNTAGPADLAFNFGVAGDLPVVGDWDGNGIDDAGVFRPATAQFLLRQQQIVFVPGPLVIFVPTLVFSNITINFGQPGDLPVAGDWDGDGIDTVGVFRNGLWELRNSNTTGPPDISFNFGAAGFLPLAGDFNGDGTDTIGVYNPPVAEFSLSNTNLLAPNPVPVVDFLVVFGLANQQPVSGDWDGDGVDSIGVFQNLTFFLSNSNEDGSVAITAAFGQLGDRPVIGDWDGKP